MEYARARRGSAGPFILVIVLVAIVTALVTALLVNIFERKAETRHRYVQPRRTRWVSMLQQEAARVLAEATDYAGQGQVAALEWLATMTGDTAAP
jgi:hypothetical protein